jgi:hypothetical protein
MRIILVILILLTFYCLFDGYYRKKEIEYFNDNIFLDNPISRKHTELINKLDNIKQNYQPNIDRIADKLLKTIEHDENYNLQTVNFENEQKEQDKRLKDITDYVSEHKFISNLNSENNNNTLDGYKSIKSLTNSQPLNLIPIINKNQNIKGYQIIANGGCLTNTSIGMTDILPCNQSNINQYFELQHITNRKDYNSSIENGEIEHDTIDDNKYPFVLTKSVSSGNCLTNYDGQVSVEVCNSNKNQQWNPSYNIVKCIHT